MVEGNKSAFILIRAMKGDPNNFLSCHLCRIRFKPGDKVQLVVETAQENEICLQLCHDDCSMKRFNGCYAGESRGGEGNG